MKSLLPLLILAVAPAAFAAGTEVQRRWLENHCFDCHDADTQKGGLDLSGLSFDPADAGGIATWEKIHDRVRDGEMPPRKRSRPPAEEMKAWLTVLDANLYAASAAQQAREGRALARRLNRDEYQNTLRDLLGVEADYRTRLPEDGRVHGFDKVGAALSVSAEHLQTYMAVAHAALEEVLQTYPSPPSPPVLYPQRWEEQHFGKDFFGRFGKTFGNQPDAIVRFGDFVDAIVGFRPVTKEGTYRFRVHARAWGGETVTARIRAGGRRQSDPSYVVAYPEFPPEGATVEVLAYLQPGETLRVTPIGIGPPGAMHRVEHLLKGKAKGGYDANTYQGPGLAMEWVEAEGPLRPSRPKHSPERWLGKLNLAKATPADAERLLVEFLPRAFRRPVTAEELRPYREIFAEVARDAGFLAGIKVALQTALCSPHFLFLDAPAGPLDDFALASRLSYFLWNTTPDDALTALAAKGGLREPKTLRAQVERMLRDPKAAAFTESFTGQWLDLRKINATTPDDQLYPEWDELLEWSSIRETRLFFDEVLRHDLSVTNFVHSDFAILNGRLATHYGIPDVKGIELRKVTLPTDSVRGGVLAQASVLKVTANGTTTSPVLRGVWVMERILGQPVPPVPAGVPAIEPDIRGATTIREQLARHRADSSCAACHDKIDPPGFALERFDVIGGWRDRYRAAGGNLTEVAQVVRPLTFDALRFVNDPTQRVPLEAQVGLGPRVDASGELPGGEPFADYPEFRRSLLTHPERLARAITQHLVTYATGTPLHYADRIEIDRIVAGTGAQSHGLRSLIHAIIQSPLFLNQ
jgi:hypothetical protein